MTNKQLRTYLEHGIGSRQIKIKRDGSILAFGSTRDTDRSMDYWQWVGYRDDIERQSRSADGLTMICNQCNGPLFILGQLADLLWARCRQCGADHTVPGQDNIDEGED